jgi:hypothetical protein
MVTKRETKIRYETAMRDCGRRYRVCRGRVELPMEPEGRVWHEPFPSIEVRLPDRREAARHTVTSRGTACASALMRQEIWEPSTPCRAQCGSSPVWVHDTAGRTSSEGTWASRQRVSGAKGVASRHDSSHGQAPRAR